MERKEIVKHKVYWSLCTGVCLNISCSAFHVIINQHSMIVPLISWGGDHICRSSDRHVAARYGAQVFGSKLIWTHISLLSKWEGDHCKSAICKLTMLWLQHFWDCKQSLINGPVVLFVINQVIYQQSHNYYIILYHSCSTVTGIHL